MPASTTSAYFSQVSAEANLSRSRASTMDDVPPPPGGFGGSGGSSGGGAIPEGEFLPPSGYTNCKTWTNFWLEISNSSDVISITISNTLPGLSYILLETTNLTQSRLGPHSNKCRLRHIRRRQSDQRGNQQIAVFSSDADRQ